MLFTFETPSGEIGSIVWGRVQSGFQGAPPVRTIQNPRTGNHVDIFSVTVGSVKEGSGKNATVRFMFEPCKSFFRDADADFESRKQHHVLSLLKPKDKVLIFGKRELNSFVSKTTGKVIERYETIVHAVIPVGWFYDILIAFYSHVVNREAKERATTVKPKSAPKVQRPVFMDEKDGAYFE